MKNKKIAVFSMLIAAICIIVPTASANELFDASLAPPGVYYGTGNVNAGFTILDTTNSVNGSELELGLEAIQRYVGPIDPSANEYDVMAGVQWDLAFSVNTNVTGISGGNTLASYVYNITIDDLTTGNVVAFNPTLLPDNAQVGADACSSNASGCTYNGANTGMQNAEWPGFSFLSVPLNYNIDADDLYNITLAANPVDGVNADPAVTIQVQVTGVAAPEPGPFLLLGGGLMALGLIPRVRRRLQR